MPSHTPAEVRKNLANNPNSDKNFIQKIKLKTGAFTAQAKKAGALTKKGTIKRSFTLQEAKKSGTTGKRARLALLFAKFAKRKKKQKAS